MTVTSVGIAGLGRMGLPVARRLVAAGLRVQGFDTGRDAMAAASAAGVQMADGPSALGTCDVSVTLLPTMAVTQTVLADITTSAVPGHIHILMGTFGPAFVAEMQAMLGERPVVLVDCPVSGSVDHAERGALTAMVGTDGNTFARIAPVLAPLCAKTFLIGEAGKAAGLKLAVNGIVGAVNHALAEALLLAEAQNIDPNIAYDVFEASVIDSPYVRYKRRHIFAHLRPADGTIRQITKDLELALGLAGNLGVTMKQAEIARATLADAGAWGDADDDLGRVFAYLRARRTGD